MGRAMETQDKPEELAIQQPEGRGPPRQAVDENATLLLLSHGSRVSCRIIELSLEGCRLRTGERFPAGAAIRVEVIFTINRIAFRLSGVTPGIDANNIVDIRFVNVISRRRDELAEVLCEVVAENLAKAEKQAAEKLAAERLAQERPARDKVERPDREHTESHVAATQPLPAAKPAPSPQQAASQPAARHAKHERRAQTRHEVDTSAVIFLINIGSALRGRILDMSLGGCRICTDERFPVGIYTRVETEFHLEGLPFRLGGVIQAVHDRDRRLVGIRFLDMSERKLAQVEQLIQEIEEMESSRKAVRTGD
ncbi:MAG TPA: PilZ domain-containing protein [Terracidiphilus sp.]|nr:PilZ domain-containing protein [Terracidiphilus sp.]